ncbi:MAG: hypothetical protein KC457_30170 [Myxococcales bacterium]|nr:hypothetical protein [Myxococcales bacterium]
MGYGRIQAPVVVLMLAACNGDSSAPAPELEAQPEIRGERVLHLSYWPWLSDGPTERIELWIEAGADPQLGTDSVLILRYEDDQGDASDRLLSWSRGRLDLYGQQRMNAALAAFDPSHLELPSGCGIVDPPIPVTLIHEGQDYEYIITCPPVGIEALADLYQEVADIGLDCPLDPDDWWDLPIAFDQLACATLDE